MTVLVLLCAGRNNRVEQVGVRSFDTYEEAQHYCALVSEETGAIGWIKAVIVQPGEFYYLSNLVR